MDDFTSEKHLRHGEEEDYRRTEGEGEEEEEEEEGRSRRRGRRRRAEGDAEEVLHSRQRTRTPSPRETAREGGPRLPKPPRATCRHALGTRPARVLHFPGGLVVREGCPRLPKPRAYPPRTRPGYVARTSPAAAWKLRRARGEVPWDPGGA